MTQMVTSNIGGTVHTSFRIHNNGPIIYQGSSQPTVGSYNDGDLWVLHTNGGSLYQYTNGAWKEIGQAASEKFEVIGDASTSKSSLNVLHTQTTSTNGETFYFDGPNGTRQLVLPADSVSIIEADFVGINITGGNQYSAGYNIKGVVTNFLGNVQFTNSPAETIYAESNDQWIVEMVPGSAGSNLVRFVAYGENNRTINWTVFARVTTAIQ
tara:strand:- start:592 stop:1224 length:633 start_codon:yes stop_codon:yes gene_type:complete